MLNTRATDLTDDAGAAPRLIDRALALAFAAPCAACEGVLDRPAASPVCDACWAAIPRDADPRCARCGVPVPDACICGDLPSTVDWLRAVGPYDGALRAILHALKYDGRQTVARGLGARLRPLLDGLPAATGYVLVPVPLHRSRGFRRGFNQAEVLARAVGGPWPVHELLVRVRASPTQTRVDRLARRRNVAHAFGVRPQRPWRRVPGLAGLRVVLVDDVVTTGATLGACAEVLRASGATWVGALTAARTPRRAGS